MSGTPDLIDENELERSVIKIIKSIDSEVDDHDIEAWHRIGKSKGNSKKTIVRFCNRKCSKRVLYNKKKIVPVITSTADLGNSTKVFISKNLTDYNNKLAFQCRKLIKASPIHSTFTRDSIVHIMQSDCDISVKMTHLG